MLTLEERAQLVELLGKMEWPVPLEVFYALCPKIIMVSTELALVRRPRKGLFCQPGEPEILLRRRDADDPYFPGKWHCPGSIVLPGDTWASTLAKILSREVGIEPGMGTERLLYVAQVARGHGPDDSPRAQEVSALFLLERDGSDVVETDQKRFFPLSDLPAPMVAHHNRYIQLVRAQCGQG